MGKMLINITNQLILTIIMTFLVFSIIMSSYYSYYIYRSFKLITIIENKYNSKLIYVKDTNMNFVNKILMTIYKNIIISINDNNSLRKLLQQNSTHKLTLIVKSSGGYISSSDSMLNLLDCHKPQKNVYVPGYAMSAATLLTLTCDKIFMNKYAVLGPTDPQITVLDEVISYRTIQKIIENKDINKIKDKILLSYYDNKNLYDENINYIKKYLKKHKRKNVLEYELDDFVDKFSFGNIPHHTEFTPNTLSKIININYDIPQDIYEIYNILNYIFEIW
jgi:hypothetical protein